MSDSGVNGTSKKIVVIADDYAGKYPHSRMDIDGDGRPELFHGHKVEGVFKAGIPDKEMPIIKRVQNNLSLSGLKKSYEEILSLNTDKNPNNNTDVVILAQGVSCPIDSVRTSDNKTFDSKELHKKEFMNAVKNTFSSNAISCIDTLEKLAKTTNVIAEAGNETKSHFNLTNLVKEVISVGGEKAKGVPHLLSADNSLIDKWSPFTYEGDLIKDKTGKPVGYDVHQLGKKGDGKADIIFGDKEGQVKLTGTKSPKDWILLGGTSFSTPHQAKKFYLEG